jgi:protein TonB
MNTYDEAQIFSGDRRMALLAAAALHVLAGFALYSGLAGTFHKKIDSPLTNLAPIPPRSDVVKPVPPEPDLRKTVIEVARPEFQDLSEPAAGPAAALEPPEPPRPILADAPRGARQFVAPRMDPQHPLRIGEDYYPDASRRANETGRCEIQLSVAQDGRIVASRIRVSSGFARLDKACLDAVRGQRMLPATEDGKPLESSITVPISWKLSEH